MVSLQQRWDASFYLCGESSSFLYQPGTRCYTPDTAPLENAWILVLKLHTGVATFMSEEDFLLRINLTNKVAKASKARAEGLHFGKKSESADILKTAEKVKTDFVSDSLHFFQYLINEVLKQTGLSTDIIKRLAIFDLFIMFKRPWKYHFDILTCSTATSVFVPGSARTMNPHTGTNILSSLTT